MGVPKGDPIALLRMLLRPGQVAVDVGASDGSVTKAAAKVVGAGGRVLAFEPDGRYQWLTVLAEFPMVDYFPVAVSDRVGMVRLFQAGKPQYSTLHEDVPKGTEPLLGVTEVRATCLDLLDGPVDVIKIDAQGSEVAIVKGGTRWLNGTTAWVVELWPHGLESAKTSGRELCDLFWNAGYEVRWADGVLVTPQALADYERDAAPPSSHCNIYAVPRAA
jgi:FkbM family methyltransferase